MPTDDPDAKILFRIEKEDGSTDVETLWAYSLGDDLYRLENSPFYAYGVSWEDTVHAPYDEAEGLPTFVAIREKSGNRTVRVLFEPPVEIGNISDELLNQLVSVGCSYEGANPSFVSINVPPGVALERVREILINADVQWEHADPTYDVFHSNRH